MKWYYASWRMPKYFATFNAFTSHCPQLLVSTAPAASCHQLAAYWPHNQLGTVEVWISMNLWWNACKHLRLQHKKIKCVSHMQKNCGSKRSWDFVGRMGEEETRRKKKHRPPEQSMKTRKKLNAHQYLCTCDQNDQKCSSTACTTVFAEDWWKVSWKVT